jgi:small subunit ribosomal protein S2e
LVDAKINLIPVRRGYWGSKIGAVHTVPIKIKGKCGSCTVRMIPAPRGTGKVAALVSKKILDFAGVDDVYTSCTG